MTYLLNSVHEIVQWPKDFNGVREEAKSYKIQLTYLLTYSMEQSPS